MNKNSIYTYMGQEIWPNMNMNIIRIDAFVHIRIQIIRYPNNTEYKYDHTEYEYIQKPLKSNKCQNLEQ